MKSKEKIIISIIGLGYVGLPLLLEFAKKYKVIGFDTDNKRINDLKKGIDQNNDIKTSDLRIIKDINITSDEKKIVNSNCYIITVPTPIKKNKKPELKIILKATRIVSRYLTKGNIIIYESTVYPGLTEEICVPEIEKISKLKYNTGFFCGYSPERINPGDSSHQLTKIKKIVSGSNKMTLKFVSKLYSSIISAGVHEVSNIKIAEAAKVIENTQRDLNIALMNELSIIFNKLNLNTKEILNAAATKWNFVRFDPGLVGGHCISVDPYYLTFKSRSQGYEPKVILAGRKTNDNMGLYVSKQLIKILKKKKMKLNKIKLLLMGVTFKENCSDVRNSQVLNIYKYLITKKIKVDLYDPIANKDVVKKIFKTNIKNILQKNHYNMIIITVAHKHFYKIGIKKIKEFCKKPELIVDVRGIFPKNESAFSL